MSKQREAKISGKVIADLRALGAFCFKVWGSEHMMAGLPDIIGCYRGHFFAFETKTPDKRNNTSARQDLVMGQIRKAGGYTDVVCSPQEAVVKLRERFDS